MPDETPRLDLTTYEQGDTDWDHTDTVEAVDEHAIVHGPIAERPSEGEYDDELYHATDQGITWRWDSDGEDWEYFSGPGSDADPTPGTVYRESISTRRMNSVEYVASDEGNEEVQARLDGGARFVYLLPGSWTFTDPVRIQNDNTLVWVDPNAYIEIDDSDYDLHEIDTSGDIPDLKAFFVFDDVKHCRITGGGTIDGDALTHDTGTAASQILIAGDSEPCEDITVDNLTVINSNPDVEGENEFGRFTEGGTPIRYQNICGVKCRDVSIHNCHTENAKYENIGVRMDYEACRIYNNYCTTGYENIQVASSTWGGSSPNDTVVGDVRDVIAFGNTVERFVEAGLVTHGRHIIFNDNVVREDIEPGMASNPGAIHFLDKEGYSGVGNVITNVDSFGFRIRCEGALSIAGNAFYNTDECVHVEELRGGMSVVGNSAFECNDFLVCEDGTGALTITDNTAMDHEGRFCHLDIGDPHLISASISDNAILHPSGTDIEASILVESGGNELRNISVTGNTIRARAGIDDGIKIVEGAGEINGLIVKNNIVEAAANGFDLPDDTPDDIIIADNIDHG